MFDNSQIASILENTQVTMFGNAEQDSASQRINAVIAQSIRQGDSAKELPLPQQICFLTDCIVVGEGMLEKFEQDEDIRAHIVSIGGADLLGQSIVIRKAELGLMRDALAEMKQRLK